MLGAQGGFLDRGVEGAVLDLQFGRTRVVRLEELSD